MSPARRMLDQIARTARQTASQTGKGCFSTPVMNALESVPRSRFVPSGLELEAYENTPLPIGFSQTISQPYIVALMTELLAVRPGLRCLEVGTGSGYQAAVLASLGVDLYTIEIIAPLYARTEPLLRELDAQHIHPVLGNGSLGYAPGAPYDRIMVTAAADEIPQTLLQQLSRGGRMVIPLRKNADEQRLYVVDKLEDGCIRSRSLLPVRFVPLIESQAA